MFTDKFPEIKQENEALHFRANRASAQVQQILNLLNAASARRLHDLERHYLKAIQRITQDNLDWLENTNPLEVVHLISDDIELEEHRFSGSWDPNSGIIGLILSQDALENGTYFLISDSDGGQFHKGDFILWDANNCVWVIVKSKL